MRKRKIKALHLCEISCVDRPAHELALATLIKSAAQGTDEIETPASGDANVDLEQAKAEIARLNGEIAKISAAQETLAKVSGLSATDRATYDDLEAADKVAFLAGGEPVRKVYADTVANRNPAVYTAEDGTVYRKSDDARLVKFAKEADDARRATKAAEQALEGKRVADEAKKIAFIPGSDELRGKVVKAMEALGDEGKTVLATLAAMSKTAAEDFEFIGTKLEKTSATDAEAAETQLNELAEKLATKSGQTFAQAYVEVLKTETGGALFTKICNA